MLVVLSKPVTSPLRAGDCRVAAAPRNDGYSGGLSVQL